MSSRRLLLLACPPTSIPFSLSFPSLAGRGRLDGDRRPRRTTPSSSSTVRTLTTGMASSLLLRSSRALGVPSRRYLSSADVTTALRPFYFLVHPDLFGRFPKEQAVNEKSIKVLKCYVDSLVAANGRPEPTSVAFYLRPPRREGGSDRSSLRFVRIDLDSADVRRTISRVLHEASLPTSFVDKMASEEPRGGKRRFFEERYDSDDLFDERMAKHHVSRQKMDVTHPLDKWLEDNVVEARRRIEVVEPIVLKSARITDELCNEYGIKNVIWASDWLKYTRINKLESLRTLLQSQEGVQELLRDREIIFCDGRSGVTLDGQLALYAGEVLENWLWHIRQIPFKESLLSNIPRVEKRLSQSLSNIRIVRRKSKTLFTLADEYRHSLRQLMESVDKFRAKNSFPPNWPASLQEFEMSVETGESPMMVSQAGQIIAPCNVSAKNLLAFICDNMEDARQKMEQARRREKEEAELMAKCVTELGLIDFHKSYGLESEKMIDCCIRLLQFAPRIRHLTHGSYLEVNTYFDVNSDGIITIPHFWLERDVSENGKS